MKKISKIFTMLVVALVGLSLTACNDGDDLSTDQYGNQISLQSFGPCPVLRGGTLYFYGTNLDQVNEIDLPGADPITAIEVLQSGRQSKISIQVPAEKCEPGQVVLKTIKGGEITSVSPVTYREDIVLDKFYVGENEESKIGNVGDVVTIKGDYLNLMHGVVFVEKDTVKEENFLKHDRYTIQVAIPAEARTGVITLTDLVKDGASLQTKEELAINTPEVTPLAEQLIKAGETLSIKGTSFDQIASVKFSGDVTVNAEDFKSQSANEITLAVPAKATEGNVSVITKSGVELAAGSIKLVVPTNLVATPDPVKNGNDVTITGKDMDLVTGIIFPNATDGEIKKVTATEVVAEVPKDAQETDKDGNGIGLQLANGTIVYVKYTLVKPVVTAYSKENITAGETVMMRGTDLDLIKSITFPGDQEQTVDTAQIKGTASAIIVPIPAACAGTGYKLNLMNGTTVEAKGGLTIVASTSPAISQPSYSATISKEATIEGKNFSNIETVYIGTVKVTKFKSRTDTSMTFTVPTTLTAGEYDLIMVAADGTKYTVGKFNALPTEIALWSGKVGPTNWDGNRTVPLTDAMKAELTPGRTIGLDLELDSNSTFWQIEVCGTWWTGLTCFKKAYAGGERAIIDVAGKNQISATLEQADIDLLNKEGGFLFVGNGVYVTRIFVK